MIAPLTYTDAEVSAMLRVSKRTVYRLRKSGVLRAVQIGRAVRIPTDALSEFIERARQNGEIKRKGNENADQSASLQPQQ